MIVKIYFYKINDPYGCFSNFSKHGFELKGKYWKTSEHYFQAMKFENTKYEEEIRLLPTPMNAAVRGRDRSLPLRAEWETVKDKIMKEAVLAKFQYNNEIKEILLGTDDNEIIEKTADDYYWGCGTAGNGKNVLGKILMEVREMLRKK